MEAHKEALTGGDSRFSGTHWLRREDDGRVSCRLTSAFRPAVTTAQLTGQRGNGIQEEDNYLLVPFRGLSATLIRDYAIDFTKDGVLKAAVGMFNELPMYVDHWLEVDNWVGRTSNAHWTDGEGDVPGGVDFMARIYKGEQLTGVYKDRQTKLLVGIQEDIINSVSATLTFQWAKSHPDMADTDFWRSLGDEIDGESVRLVVTKIDWVGEISLVWAGADPYAKRRGMSLEARMQGSEDITYSIERRKLEKANTDLRNTLEEARFELTQLKAENAELRLARDEVSNVRSEMIERITTIGNLLSDDTMRSEAFRNFMKTQTLSALKATLEAAQRKLEALMPMRCSDCGSTNVERRNSVVGSNLGKGNNVNEQQFKLGGSK